MKKIGTWKCFLLNNLWRYSCRLHPVQAILSSPGHSPPQDTAVELEHKYTKEI